MSTAFLSRLFTAALTLAASLSVIGAATTASFAAGTTAPALTSYAVSANGDQGDDIHTPIHKNGDDPESDKPLAVKDLDRHIVSDHADIRHSHVLTPAGAYCKISSSCGKLVAATFIVTGSGTADSIVIDHGPVDGFHSESFPFTRTYLVDPNIALLQVHESGAHQTSVGCTIKLNGKIVSSHSGADCVYSKN